MPLENIPLSFLCIYHCLCPILKKSPKIFLGTNALGKPVGEFGILFWMVFKLLLLVLSVASRPAAPWAAPSALLEDALASPL